MPAKFSKQLQTLRKHLPAEAVDALASMIASAGVPMEMHSPILLSGISGQSTVPWAEKRKDVPAFQMALQAEDKSALLLKGPTMGVGRWCKALSVPASSTNAKNGRTEYRIYARDTDDEQGLTTNGTTFVVLLQYTGGKIPTVSIGDILMYFYAEDGQRVAFPSEASSYPAAAPMRAATAPASAYMPKIATRNLIYHVYPSKENTVWLANLKQLTKRKKVFNGKCLFALAVDDTTLPAVDVMKEIQRDWPHAKFSPFTNDKRLRETASFLTLLKGVKNVNANEATFYGHTKGIGCESSDHPKASEGAMYWRNACYHHLLDYPDNIMRLLARHPMVGCFHTARTESHETLLWPTGWEFGNWFYAGTYFWFRHDRVFTNPAWSMIADDRYAAEAWPGGLFTLEECPSVYNLWPSRQWHPPNHYDPNLYPDKIADDPEG